MNFEQIKSQWQQQINQLPSSAEEPMMTVIEDKMITLDSQIKNRTLYGVLTFSIIIISLSGFNYFLYQLKMPILAISGLGFWIAVFAMASLLILKINHCNINYLVSMRKLNFIHQ